MKISIGFLIGAVIGGIVSALFIVPPQVALGVTLGMIGGHVVPFWFGMK